MKLRMEVRLTITKQQGLPIGMGISRKYIDSEIKDIAVINKAFKPIWELTYKIVSGEENESVKVVNKDPHNLLLSWIRSGKIYCEELKVSNII